MTGMCDKDGKVIPIEDGRLFWLIVSIIGIILGIIFLLLIMCYESTSIS